MRYALILCLLSLPLWPAHAAEWKDSVGPNATVWLTLDHGVFSLTFEERWAEKRSSTATGTYTMEEGVLQLWTERVTFEGAGKDARDPLQGFVVETPRKATTQADPSLTLRPNLPARVRAREGHQLLELRGDGGFELNLRPSNG